MKSKFFSENVFIQNLFILVNSKLLAIQKKFMYYAIETIHINILWNVYLLKLNEKMKIFYFKY